MSSYRRQAPGRWSLKTALSAQISVRVLAVLDEWNSAFFDLGGESNRLQTKLEDAIETVVTRWMDEQKIS